MNAPEMWQLVHSCYGDELGLTSDDEDYVPPLPAPDEEKLSTRLSVESFSEVIYILTYQKLILMFGAGVYYQSACVLFLFFDIMY